MAKYIIVEKDNYAGLITFGCISFLLYIIYQKLEPYFWICGIVACVLLLIYCALKMRRDCNVYGYVVFTIGILLSVFLTVTIVYEHYYSSPTPAIVKKKDNKVINKKKHSQKKSNLNKKNANSSPQ